MAISVTKKRELILPCRHWNCKFHKLVLELCESSLVAETAKFSSVLSHSGVQLQSEQSFETLKLILPQFTVIRQAHSSGLTYSRLHRKTNNRKTELEKFKKKKKIMNMNWREIATQSKSGGKVSDTLWTFLNANLWLTLNIN